MTNGALNCQHSSVDLALTALIAVIFRREGVGDGFDKLEAGPINLQALMRITALKRIARDILGCGLLDKFL